MGLSTNQKLSLISVAVVLMLIHFSMQHFSSVEISLENIKNMVGHQSKVQAGHNVHEITNELEFEVNSEMEFKHIENEGRSPPGSGSPQEEFDRLWDYAYNMQYQCKESEYLGGKPQMLRDGAYSLCTEDRFWPVKKDPEHKCLMYSIGVGWNGGDFTFDDEIARRGCEVHAFDPFTELDDGTVRESGVVFHKIGIDSQDIEKNEKGWKMRTLKTLLMELNHQGRHLDYLKIDTDAPQGGFEDTLMQELIDTGMHRCVRQYAMEIHLVGPISNADKLKRCRALYRQMATLDSFGWRLYNTTDNVRLIQKKQNKPDYSNKNIRPGIVNGGSILLWETAFVNFGVKGPCIPNNP